MKRLIVLVACCCYALSAVAQVSDIGLEVKETIKKRRELERFRETGRTEQRNLQIILRNYKNTPSGELTVRWGFLKKNVKTVGFAMIAPGLTRTTYKRRSMTAGHCRWIATSGRDRVFDAE
jgi:hypothetical protein